MRPPASCLYCGKALSLLSRLGDGQYCSRAHRRLFKQTQDRMAVDALAWHRSITLQGRTEAVLARSRTRKDPPFAQSISLISVLAQPTSDRTRGKELLEASVPAEFPSELNCRPIVSSPRATSSLFLKLGKKVAFENSPLAAARESHRQIELDSLQLPPKGDLRELAIQWMLTRMPYPHEERLLKAAPTVIFGATATTLGPRDHQIASGIFGFIESKPCLPSLDYQFSIAPISNNPEPLSNRSELVRLPKGRVNRFRPIDVDCGLLSFQPLGVDDPDRPPNRERSVGRSLEAMKKVVGGPVACKRPPIEKGTRKQMTGMAKGIFIPQIRFTSVTINAVLEQTLLAMSGKPSGSGNTGFMLAPGA
jgi:hypothetical protein